MSILIDRNTRVMTQGITGKTGAFHTRLCRDYANGKDCFVAGVNPNKAGENFEGIPIFGTVAGSQGADRCDRFGDLRAAALRGRRHRRGGRCRTRSGHLHHRGRAGARHDRDALPHARQEDAAGGPELSRA